MVKVSCTQFFHPLLILCHGIEVYILQTNIFFALCMFIVIEVLEREGKRKREIERKGTNCSHLSLIKYKWKPAECVGEIVDAV